MNDIDFTHDPAARSWVLSANVGGNDFPIQNLPFGSFKPMNYEGLFRCGVAIGDQVIDLGALTCTGALDGVALAAARTCTGPYLNDFLSAGPAAWRALRQALFALLKEGATAHQAEVQACLHAMHDIEMGLPMRVGDYTDFYTSIYHARSISTLLNPEGELPRNFQWIPTAYHGRVSSIGVAGQTFRRPHGQALRGDSATPEYAPCRRLDYELELGLYIGVGNAQGDPIGLSEATDHAFGICLLNDWSARDIQAWEMAPLGPFHAKNFATTVSPWIVTMDALAPFRQAWMRPASDPQPLPYLDDPSNRERGAMDIRLEVSIETARMRADRLVPHRLTETTFAHHYWTFGQMITHHAAGGCNLMPGDLLGSGTISGPDRSEAGAMMELALAGKEPVRLPNGETRSFLEDGDAVFFKGWCERDGFARIGFGINHGQVLPAHP